jgi:hypothetical protein
MLRSPFFSLLIFLFILSCKEKTTVSVTPNPIKKEASLLRENALTNFNKKNFNSAFYYFNKSKITFETIKDQLKDSPIEFDNFLLVKNVILENENYVILFRKEKEILKFRNRDEFLSSFISFIDIKINQFEEEFKDLQKFESMSMGIKYDENEVYMRHESIGHGTSKLNQIREKLVNAKKSSLK